MKERKRVHFEQELSRLASQLPETRWIILFDHDGLEKARFPKILGEADRIAAMSSATLSLGERITKELQGGDMKYCLIGGSENTFLFLELSDSFLLTLGIRPGVSIDKIFQALQENIEPLLRTLEIDATMRWRIS